MIWLQAIALVVLLGVCSLGPGFFIVRRWRLGPAEKLCVALGLSFVLLYLAQFGIYLLKLPTAANYAVSGLCAVLLLLSGRDLLKLLRRRQVYRLLGGIGLVLLWGLLLLSLVRSYAGGGWTADWIEHYQRVLFFLGRLKLDFQYIGIYLLPARPPLMNAVAAFFLRQVGLDFQLFQILFLVLNAVVFLPCYLIARTWMRRPGYLLSLCVCLFMANPLFMENITYAWTKLFSGFYVVLAVWLYVKGWRQRDWRRIVLAFVSLSAAALVHYSAGPYLVFLALHYIVWTFWHHRPHRWRELSLTALLSAAVLMSWFGWSLVVFGREGTFASNTSVGETSIRTPAENLAKIAGNFFDTVVPHLLRGQSIPIIEQENSLGLLRDNMFLVYQTTLIAAMGIVGGLLVLERLYRGLRASAIPRDLRWFWGLFVVSCTILGVVVVGERNEAGSAHLCLQPLVLMGVAFLAAQFARFSRPTRFLLIVGAIVDFALGILLQFNLESIAFEAVSLGNNRYTLTLVEGLSRTAGGNWKDKMRVGAVFWGDQFAGYSSVLLVLVLAGFALVVWRMTIAAIDRNPLHRLPVAARAPVPGRSKKQLARPTSRAKR